VYSVAISREIVCYADRIRVECNNSEGETILPSTGLTYAIFCQMLEICLRKLQNNIACSLELHLSVTQFDVFVICWSAPL
jgi:hypothetical protein